MADGDHTDSGSRGSRRIADNLKREIEQGVYPPGAKLKSVRELEAEYGVARNTASAAIRLLQTLGLVEVRAGSGAYVRQREPGVSLSEDLPRLRAELAEVQDQVRRTKLALSKAERALGEIVDRLPPEMPAD
ncbi:winged helix-turn-helix domain-containing protein [Nonomuraea muscovyensis]|uniref:GntR family transcriptional regulator n=1 Tax=Nonomuraea muscovyensis TaxID=1124761 RepID=UPI0033FAC6C2